jgi:hypothetical protein
MSVRFGKRCDAPQMSTKSFDKIVHVSKGANAFSVRRWRVFGRGSGAVVLCVFLNLQISWSCNCYRGIVQAVCVCVYVRVCVCVCVCVSSCVVLCATRGGQSTTRDGGERRLGTYFAMCGNV